jgi:anaerobic magnesium-protoporphyrin IX monomethyl ester cyclase
MTSVLLVYPFFRRPLDRSRFRFPPLGIAYIASSLRQAGHDVRLLDCTFLRRDEALTRARGAGADVVGIYAMAGMEDDCLRLARGLRGHCRLLVAGGPLPTCEPERFAAAFDVVVRGEAEATMVELLAAYEGGGDLAVVPGVAFRARRGGGEQPLAAAPARPFVRDLDALPFPARDLLPNAAYIAAGRRSYGYSITTVMSTRGCPFTCEFCSNVVFGDSYRARSAANVVDEVEQALALGYDRISFADDVFTLDRRRVLQICDEIERRGLKFLWECLGRVDTFDAQTAARMREAGCFRIFFGIESGNDRILALMDKRITTAQARGAVETAHAAGLQVGAFFILCYPGDSDETALDTIRFATSLPLDYAGIGLPYPLPGTALLERLGGRTARPWRPQQRLLVSHERIVDGDFSAGKMRLALVKARAQVELKRRLGRYGPAAARLVEVPTDRLFRLMK